MKKTVQTPGTVLQSLLEKHDLNCNRLAKAIGMSNAMVRLIILDKSPVSVPAAFRLGKFFKNEPESWLTLQMNFDLSQAALDKNLAKEVSAITDVSKFTFVRKPHTPKAPGTKTSRKKATLADKRKAASKIPGKKPARTAGRPPRSK